MHNNFININGVTIVSDKEGNISILEQKDNVKEILDKENEIESLKNTIDVVKSEYIRALKEYEEIEEQIEIKKENNGKILKNNIFKGIFASLSTIMASLIVGKIYFMDLPNLDSFVNIFSILSGVTMFSICLGHIINKQKKYKEENKRLKCRKDTAATKSMSTLGKKMELEKELQELMLQKTESNNVLKKEYNVINLDTTFPEYQQLQEDVQTNLYYPYILEEEKSQQRSRKRR